MAKETTLTMNTKQENVFKGWRFKSKIYFVCFLFYKLLWRRLFFVSFTCQRYLLPLWSWSFLSWLTPYTPSNSTKYNDLGVLVYFCVICIRNATWCHLRLCLTELFELLSIFVIMLLSKFSALCSYWIAILKNIPCPWYGLCFLKYFMMVRY